MCLINTIITYGVEALFIKKYTIRYDIQKENQKTENFSKEMEKMIMFLESFYFTAPVLILWIKRKEF